MIFLHVIKKELLEKKRLLCIYAAAVTLILLIQELFDAFIAWQTQFVLPAAENYSGSFSLFLFFGGLILTSTIFAQDLFSKTAQHNYLMLPASQLEKFLAKGLLTAVGYPVVLALLFGISSVGIELITRIFFDSPILLFNPFSRATLQLIGHYLAIQSVFLLGATYFRKAHFVKTVLALGLLGIVVGLFTAALMRIAFAPYMEQLRSMQIMVDASAIQDHQTLFGVFKWIGSLVYWLIVPLFCYFTAYQRVKEVEATDAI